MHKSHLKLALLSALVLPGTAFAESFTGLAIGGGISQHSLDVDGNFSGSPPFSRGSTSDSGGFLDIGYTGAPNDKIRLTGGFRVYTVSSETKVFADDRAEVENLSVFYGRLGYVIEEINMIYGILEVGGADVTIHTDGYSSVSDELAATALGIGYARALNGNLNLSVEFIGRSYEDFEVNYSGGHLDGTRTIYEFEESTLVLGLYWQF